MVAGCYMVMGSVEWVRDCLMVFDESMVLVVFGGWLCLMVVVEG